METQVVYNSDLHFEHRLWKNELLFWKDEIKSFQNRLDELITRWTDKEVLKELSQFQNKFIIHNNKIEEFLDKIDSAVNKVKEEAAGSIEEFCSIIFKTHEENKNQVPVSIFKRIFQWKK